MNRSAILGGPKAVKSEHEELFHWPIVTDEDIAAITAVLRAGNMSGTDITKEFEARYAEWNQVKYALGTCNGTAALLAAMWACGVGAGDEIIAPSMTYWASCAPALMLGATVNFTDIDPETLCIDPGDIEHRIGPRTRAIVVVNYGGMPADYEAILPLAKKHHLPVIEDNSHAHGAMRHGRMCGSFGDISCASLMSGKSFATGEAGIITTDDRRLYERCIAFGHYERTGLPSNYNPADCQVNDPELTPFRGMPIGAVKHRMNQTCSAMGLIQLRHYSERIAEIDRAMNYFCDRIDEIPGFRGVRPREAGITKGGWYAPQCHYDASQLGGLPLSRAAEALEAEGCPVHLGANAPLHLHRYFHEADIFHQGKPTVIAFGQRDLRQGPGSLPVTEGLRECVCSIPWFKHFDRAAIDEYVEAFAKTAANAGELKK